MSQPTITQLLEAPQPLSPPLTSLARYLLIGLLQVSESAAGEAGGATRTPVSSVVTGDGAIAAGKKWVQFILSPDFAGTINGATFAGATDAVQELPVLSGADSYAAIPYTISAGSARLTTF